MPKLDPKVEPFVQSTTEQNGVRYTILKPGNAEGAQMAEYPDRQDPYRIRQWPN